MKLQSRMVPMSLALAILLTPVWGFSQAAWRLGEVRQAEARHRELASSAVALANEILAKLRDAPEATPERKALIEEMRRWILHNGGKPA